MVQYNYNLIESNTNQGIGQAKTSVNLRWILPL